MEKEFLAYIAGLFDGEGCLLINKKNYQNQPNRNPRYAVVARVNMCDLKPIRIIQNTWGGSIFRVKRDHNPKWRDTYMVTLASKLGISFLKDIYPFLIVKKRQVDIIFEFERIRKSRLGKSFSNEIINELENLFNKLKREKKISEN